MSNIRVFKFDAVAASYREAIAKEAVKEQTKHIA